MSAKYFGIFVWINDDPVTGNVLNLANIVDPRKPIEQYKEKEKVKVKCPGYGLQDAVLARISDEAGKKELCDVLTGRAFKDLVENLDVDHGVSHTCTPKEDATNKDSTREEKVQKQNPESEKIKKRKHQEEIRKENSKTETIKKRKDGTETGAEVNAAKKEQQKEKQEQEKSRKDMNFQVSNQMMSSATTDIQNKMDLILTKVASLAQKVESMQQQQQNLTTGQHQICQKLESLLAIAQCSKCLRAQYQLNKLKGKASQSHPHQKLSGLRVTKLTSRHRRP